MRKVDVLARGWEFGYTSTYMSLKVYTRVETLFPLSLPSDTQAWAEISIEIYLANWHWLCYIDSCIDRWHGSIDRWIDRWIDRYGYVCFYLRLSIRNTCDVTSSYVWRDTFIRVTWLVHMLDMRDWYLIRMFEFICLSSDTACYISVVNV